MAKKLNLKEEITFVMKRKHYVAKRFGNENIYHIYSKSGMYVCDSPVLDESALLKLGVF